jgi:hypothetical protein
MNLFKKLGERFKLQNREAKATEAPKGPPPFIWTGIVPVPVGYVMPLGQPITVPFQLVIEAGVRWHPEWEEPRITVNLWRILPLGDAIGWAGDKALEAFKTLLSADVVALAAFHGQTVTPASQRLLDKLGLTAPKVQQPLSTFNTFRNVK